MKKKLALFLCLLLTAALLPVPAQALMSRLEVFEEHVLIEERKDGVNVYVFARLENTGRTKIEYDSGRFDVYDKAGVLLGSDEYPAVFAAKFMSPGEHGYLKACVSLDGVKAADIGDCKLKVAQGKEYKGRAKIERYACEPVYQEDVVYGGWLYYDYMGATVTNTTKKILYDLEAVFVLYSEDGTILNIGYAFMGLLNDIGLHPGSTVTMRDINTDTVQAAYKKEGYAPARVEAIAYVEVYV